MEIIYNTIFICFFYIITGKIFLNLKNSLSNICFLIIVGSIILSFISLTANFFIKLNLINNSILLILIFLIFFYKFPYKTVLSKNFIIPLLIVSLLSTILIYLADSNRPDSGLYHYPFIKLINDENIIFGLTNINSRFGHISILQYLQAISNNYVTGTNGMLLPLSIIPAAIYLYFFCEIFLNLKKKINNKIYILFLFLSIIFFTFKMNRYGEYGNDYLPHFLLFLLISLLLKYENKIKFSNTYFFSVFIFLNKASFITIFAIPFILFVKRLNKEKIINLRIIFSTLFLLLWVIKNIIHSGCLIWPIENSCIKNLPWTNNDLRSIQHVSNVNTITEAWSKAWPDNRYKKIDMRDYVKDFKWVDTWLNNHGKKIGKILTIYLILIFLILFFMSINSKKMRKLNFINTKNLFIYLLVFILSCALWFMKFPVFRFGISFIIISFILIFIIFFNNIELNRLNSKFIKYICIFCVSIFVLKNTIKLKNYFVFYDNHPWPKYYGFDKMNKVKKLQEVKLSNQKSHYLAKGLCMYSLSPCTNEKVSDYLEYKKIYNYKIYYFQNGYYK